MNDENHDHHAYVVPYIWIWHEELTFFCFSLFCFFWGARSWWRPTSRYISRGMRLREPICRWTSIHDAFFVADVCSWVTKKASIAIITGSKTLRDVKTWVLFFVFCPWGAAATVVSTFERSGETRWSMASLDDDDDGTNYARIYESSW